jgi:SAM-dependent methyltransferase
MRIDLRRGEKLVNLFRSLARGASMGRSVKHHPIPLNKPCEIEDFTNPGLLMTMRRVHSHEVKHCGCDWPRGTEHRKLWEVAMAILAMQRYGVLRDDAIVLGVGAGREPTTFYLTNFVRWVFATDLYAGTPGEWDEVAPVTMLTNPEALSPIPFRPTRLVVQHMDGRSLRYENETFDAIYSSSSIEHFGDWEDVAAAAREMGRVLKPGGLLALSTEYRIAGEGKGFPGVLAFNQEELFSLIVEPSGLVPVDTPQFAISEKTLSRIVPFAERVEFFQQIHRGEQAQWATYPHIVLEDQGYSFTSYHLALVKPR